MGHVLPTGRVCAWPCALNFCPGHALPAAKANFAQAGLQMQRRASLLAGFGHIFKQQGGCFAAAVKIRTDHSAHALHQFGHKLARHGEYLGAARITQRNITRADHAALRVGRQAAVPHQPHAAHAALTCGAPQLRFNARSATRAGSLPISRARRSSSSLARSMRPRMASQASSSCA